MIIKEAVTYSKDPTVENFWAGVCRISDGTYAMDIVLPPAKTGLEDYKRAISNFDAQQVGLNPDSHTIEVKHIHTEYRFSIDPTYKKSSYVEWRKAQ